MILFERPDIEHHQRWRGGTWGPLMTHLSEQTDLQDALDAKASTDQLTSEVSAFKTLAGMQQPNSS